MQKSQENILKLFRLQTVLKECGHDLNITVFAHTTNVDWTLYIGGYRKEDPEKLEGRFYYAGELASDEKMDEAITSLLDFVYDRNLLWS